MEPHQTVTLILVVEQNDIVFIVSLLNTDAWIDIWKKREKDPSFVLSSFEPHHNVTLLLLVGQTDNKYCVILPTSRRRVTLC